MTTTPQNDQVFAKFMVALGKKIIERIDEREMLHSQMKADLASANAQVTSKPHDLLKMQAAQAMLLANNPAISSVSFGMGGKTVGHYEFGQDINEEELEIIRAYFRGDDVLTTILSQER